MAQPYVGELRMFAGNYAPLDWMFCEGQLLPISQYETLYQLIGTTYGGDGQVTFGLPDLRGRIPLHMGNGFTLAESGGVEQVTLTTSHLPNHGHALSAAVDNASRTTASGNVLAQAPTFTPYVSGAPANALLAVNAISSVGGNQPHNNMQPYLCVSFIISMAGIFPTQT